ncbi:cytochrome c [Desulfovibrio ferrophilus]|uniref:Cytochrome c n=1 Tax=Desulfovibrio ferrophilus TaxID=241368 RepID=A0A2Z6AUJ8_9BACT|nr:cytochrome c [Desulfovibrio ferrophilus]BBD06909.1 putative uncharacterized protein [Desulfovibrio ferrophilus]
MRVTIAITVCTLVVLMAASVLNAQSVYVPGKAKPEQVVKARKFAMRALNSNLRDIRFKLKRGDSDGMLTPALNLSAIARFLPYAFVEKHEAAYPLKGSNKYFKGGAPEEIQAGAEYLNVQAAKLLNMATSKNMKALDQQNNRIKRACVSCHSQFRGEF